MLTLHLSARNIAICEAQGLDIFVPCPMCHLALSEAKAVLAESKDLLQRVREKLDTEGLTYKGTAKLYHTVDLLTDVAGIDVIKARATKPLNGMDLATHYGCHIIRPSLLGRPQDPENPIGMERIIAALGGRSSHYPERLDCCGGPLLPNHPDTAVTKTGEKLKAVQEQGFDGMVLACPRCHKMFDSKQRKGGEVVGAQLNLPVIYLTQLVGLAMGIGPSKLGLDLNQSPVERLMEKMGVPV
jgi:heterodisulfide reductase subunit B